MNKVISIHLRGIAFQLEEPGYDALRAYLENAERQLSGNPDKAEIIADIEQAIADKFRGTLGTSRNVVLTSEVEAVIKEMGPVTDDSADDEPSSSDAKRGPAPRTTETSDSASTPRRLYRIKEGAMLGGVCNGLAAYIGIDVTLLRLAVAILIFFSFGTVAIAYIVGMIIIPQAETPEERSAATGPAPTAQEFIRKAKEGYYEGFRTFGDRHAHRAWKKKFKREMKDWSQRLRQEYRWGCPPPPPPAANITPPPPPPEGAHVVMPLLGTIKALFLFFCVLVIISLATSGTVFGLTLPGGLPVWAGIVLAVLAYKVAVAPIKAIRRNYYYRLNGWAVHWSPITEFWLSLLPIVALVIGVWLADRLIPGVHEALLNLPVFIQNAAEAIRHWWTNK
ncbi:MAG: PspC domain-containing protein [Nibricoccus sp.]